MGKLLLSLALLAGCGAPAPSTLGDFYDEYAAESCRRAARCGVFGASQIDSCASSEREFIAAYYLTPYGFEAALAAQRIAYDPAVAAACLDELRNVGCNAFDDRRCAFLVKGLVPEGGACTRSIECKNGYCTGQNSSCGAGKCTAYVATGADCGSSSCNPATDFCPGATRTCTAFLPRGAACTSGSNCQAGLGCLGSPQGTCQPPGGSGASCSFAGPGCAGGFYCDQMTATCQARLGAGASCASSVCAEGFECAIPSGAPAGTCQPLLDVAAPCDPTALTDLCPLAAPCDPSTRQCKPIPSLLGADCSATKSCMSNTSRFEPKPLYCDSATLKCLPMAPAGAACTPPPNPSFEEPCFDTLCDFATNTCPACQ